MKAARYLRGGLNGKGKPTPMSVAELIALPKLAENKVAQNRVEDIEQMKVEARPIELDLISDALDLPGDWFYGDDPARRFAAGARREAARRGENPPQGPGVPRDEDGPGARA